MEDLFEMMTQPRKRRSARPTKYESDSLREAMGGHSRGFRDPNWLDLDHALATKPRSAAEEFETEWGGEEENPTADPKGIEFDM